ncbi:MAG: peptidylprolyl isomerase [Bacteroidetes bacterium]|nr:peptidylprolyl isomerase [Bacteroidota bacterium]
MALMTKIRDNMTKAFAVFAALFIVYIVLDWGMDFLGRRTHGLSESDAIGIVNGREISFKYFSERVRQALENYKTQNNREPDEEVERQLQSQVWNQLVDEILIEQEIQRLGITVTDQEILDIVQGPNPPEFLVRQFRDSTGTFRRDIYEQAMADPQNKEAWLQVEDIIRQQQKHAKLQSILLSAIQVSESEVRQRFIDENSTLEADYVLFDVNRLIPDSAVTITDEDLKKIYDEQPEQFKTKPTRKVQYVQFVIQPSIQDTQAVINEALHLKEQITSGSLDFMEAARTYSEVPVTEAFFAHGELSIQKDDAVFNAKKGEVVGPIVDNDGCHLLKVIDTREGTTEFVRTRHILLQASLGPDSTKALEEARSILKQLKSGANFTELARKYSQDYGSAARGGDLGWAKRGTFVKPYEDAMFRTPVGQITGPIRSQFGYHIIKVEGRSKKEVKLAALTLKIKPSPETRDYVYQQAQDFVYLAKEEGFEKAAEHSQYTVRETPEFTKGGYIPGIGLHDGVVSFAFTNKVGAISDPLSMAQGYIVCKVSAVRDDEMRPLEEVKPMLRSIALHKKKLELIYPEVEAFYKSLSLNADIIAAAASVPRATAQRTGPFKPSGFPAGVGRDLKFIGTALGLNVGQISKPIEGNRGYYIIKLTAKSPFDSSHYKAVRKTLYSSILQEKQSTFLNNWLTSLREKATIEDYRLKFYR